MGQDTFEFNFQLHERFNERLADGQPYMAMRLLCESPKHGVLSAILNCLAVVWAKQIYAVGLGEGDAKG